MKGIWRGVGGGGVDEQVEKRKVKQKTENRTGTEHKT